MTGAEDAKAGRRGTGLARASATLTGRPWGHNPGCRNNARASNAIPTYSSKPARNIVRGMAVKMGTAIGMARRRAPVAA